jgi:hypothetical protein
MSGCRRMPRRTYAAQDRRRERTLMGPVEYLKGLASGEIRAPELCAAPGRMLPLQVQGDPNKPLGIGDLDAGAPGSTLLTRIHSVASAKNEEGWADA